MIQTTKKYFCVTAPCGARQRPTFAQGFGGQASVTLDPEERRLRATRGQTKTLRRAEPGTWGGFCKRGFTIVETLVAIAILMIAVAGPLVIANKGLAAAIYAKDQSIAYFLAQEEMEIIRNVKDQYIYQQSNGFQVFVDEIDINNCSQNNSVNCNYYLSTSGGNSIQGYFSSNNLYKKGLFGYTPQPDKNQTKFHRYFRFRRIGSGDKEIEVTVYVSWKEGEKDNQISITSNMVSEVL